MNLKFISEVGATTLVGVAAFGWIFTQSPSPEQLKAPKSAKLPVAQSQTSNRGDQIPTVVQKTSKPFAVQIEPVALQTPDQTLSPAQDLYEVAATNLKMRSGPSSSTQLINTYARGSTFEKISQQGSWFQVRSTEDGTSGWMFSDYLKASN
jgi:uncharacterized protein YgiM (DUF1202 family)